MAITKVTRTLLSTGIVDNSNATAITIDSSENVGIGTSSPSQVLHLGGASNKTVQVTSSTSNAGYFGVYQDTVGLTVNRDHSDGTFADTGKTEAAIVLQSQNANSFITFRTTTTNNVEATERLRIDSSGNVGLGTTAPSSGMQIKGDGKSLKVSSVDYDIGFLGSVGSGGTSVDKGYFYLKNTGTTKIQLHSDGDSYFNGGDIGIGTSSPTEKLTVNGALAITGALADDRTSTAAMDFSGGLTRFISYGASGTGGEFAFRTASGGSSSVERLRIDDEGHIGINMTPSPVGNDKVLSIYESNTPRIKLHNASTGTAGTDGGEINMSGTDFIFENREAGNLRFFNNGSERMRIDSLGRLGIGTTTPGTFIHVKTTSPGIAMTDTNSFSDAEDRFQIRANADVGQFQWFDNSTSTTHTLMTLDQSGVISADGVYSTTTSDAANVRVLSNGNIVRSTSSERYKNTITDASKGLTELNNLRPVTYKGNNDGNTVFYGLIAEEVHEAGLTEFVEYNDDNEPDALRYPHMVSLCIKAIQEQQTIIDDLKTKIETLENA
tara:strand:- start:47 stop:1699 length:1653 start_codon:yes stop_codon:yes gene_type:complete